MSLPQQQQPRNRALFFSAILVAILAMGLRTVQGRADEKKSIIENNVSQHPLGFQEKPDGVQDTPLAYVPKPSGFEENSIGFQPQPSNMRGTPPGQLEKPRGYSTEPPGFVEKESHPLVSTNPSLQISLDNFWLINKEPALHMTPENHPARSNREESK